MLADDARMSLFGMSFFTGAPWRSAFSVLLATTMFAGGVEENVPQAWGGLGAPPPETPTAGGGGYSDSRSNGDGDGSLPAATIDGNLHTGKNVNGAMVDEWEQSLLPAVEQHEAWRNKALESTSGCDGGKDAVFTHRQLQLILCNTYVDTAGNTLCPAEYTPVENSVSCGVEAACNADTCCKDLTALPTPTPAPPPEDSCASYVDPTSGGTRCPAGYTPVPNGEGVSCDIEVGCDFSTCCEEGASMSAPSPSLTNGPSAGPTPALSSAPTEALHSGPSLGSSFRSTSDPSTTPSDGPSEGAEWGPSPGPTPGPRLLLSPGPTVAQSPGAGLVPSLAPFVGPDPAPSSRPVPSPSPDPTTSPTQAPSPAPASGSAPISSRVPSPAPSPGLGQAAPPGAPTGPGQAFIPSSTLRPSSVSSPDPSTRSPGPSSGTSPTSSSGRTPPPSPAPSPGSVSPPSLTSASSSTPGIDPPPSPGPTLPPPSELGIIPSPSPTSPSWPIQGPLPAPPSSPTPRPSPAVTPPSGDTTPPGNSLSPGATLVPTLGMASSSLELASPPAVDATVTPTEMFERTTSSAPGSTSSPEETLTPSGEKALGSSAPTLSSPLSTAAPGEAPPVPRGTLGPVSVLSPTASPVARDTLAPGVTTVPGSSPLSGSTRAPGMVTRPTTPAPATSPALGATVTPASTRVPGSSQSPAETWAPNLAEDVPVLPPVSTSEPGTTVDPTATTAPDTSTAPVANRELPTSAPGTADQVVEGTGSTAAGAVSILVVIGILLASGGSTIRLNQTGNAPVPPMGGPVGSTADGSLLLPVGGLMGRTSDERDRRHVSHRRPAATLAFVLMTQLQFLAMLSLVDYTVSQDSLLADFVLGLRWVNLWWSAELAKDIASEGCLFEAGASDIGALVFVGNLALVMGTLLGVFLVHVSVVSGIEAFWLTKKHARANLDAARRRGAPNIELRARLRGERGVRRRSPRLTEANHSNTQARASRNVFPVGESPDHSGEEEGGRPLVPMTSESLLNPVAACREQSTSAWLHFPHVELVFLFFAFEGAVASFASAMKYSECPEMFYTAVVAMVLYPLLMFVTVFRTVLVRVRPDTLLVFKPFDDDSANCSTSSTLGIHDPGHPVPPWITWTALPLITKVQEQLDDRLQSLFSWADKGQWETVQMPNRQVTREGNWFRIGFEPIFADYTKRGVWFAVISLVEAASIAMVGVLIDDSVVQLFLLGGLHLTILVILLCLKPFANSAINNIGALTMAIDSVSVGLLGVAAAKWEGTSKAEQANTVVVVLQLVSLCALVIPVYLDAGTVLLWAICKRIRKTLARTEQEATKKDREARAYIRVYICRHLLGAWCAMIRYNISACARDTSEGVRKPRFPTASRSGPHPVVDPTTVQGDADGGGSLHCRTG